MQSLVWQAGFLEAAVEIATQHQAIHEILLVVFVVMMIIKHHILARILTPFAEINLVAKTMQLAALDDQHMIEEQATEHQANLLKWMVMFLFLQLNLALWAEDPKRYQCQTMFLVAGKASASAWDNFALYDH